VLKKGPVIIGPFVLNYLIVRIIRIVLNHSVNLKWDSYCGSILRYVCRYFRHF